jgi:regulator of protease activity HflC (stomatin/prohibitin superfamily)
MSPDIEHSDNPLAKFGPQVAGAAILLLLGGAALSRVGCDNHHTPPGKAGYIRSTPMVGAGEYVGTQVGPTSTGWVWRQKIENIDIRSRTYTEDMTIPTADRLRVDLRAHARIRPNPDAIRGLVEEFGGTNWYVNNVRDQFRSAVRNRVQVLEPFEIKSKMREIGDEVLADLKVSYEGKPIIFESVDIGDIKYPPQIVASVVRKLVTVEDKERAKIRAAIASEGIRIGIAKAEGDAKAQEVIRMTLDPMYLQFDAVRALEDLADSKNTNFLIMPMSEKGQSPVIMNLGK